MSEWKNIPLPGCLIRHRIGRANQINTAEIQPIGEYPVVDQGQTFISGYTDDATRVISEGLPYVIFGDHTRCFKYVDFPFVLGADGTKVLKPNPDLFEAKFFYYGSLALEIPSRGYNRHFTLLKEKSLPRPELAEQRQIAAVLSAVQRAIERQERLIALTAELKKALMHKLFTEGARGEPQKQTEIGPVPESWRVAPLTEFTESFQYGSSVKCGYDVKGPPVLRIPNVIGGHLDVHDLKFGNPKKNELNTVRLRTDDLLFVRTNGVRENAGRCSMYRGELGDSCYFASYLIRVRLLAGLLPAFLEEYTRTETGVRLLAGRAIRTADGKFNINTGTLETLLVPKPDVDEQKVIVNALTTMDAKARNHVASQRALESLFRTLLHQLMTAEIRVGEFDLSALETAAAAGAA
jgi:type I restriction enzyme S subunit